MLSADGGKLAPWPLEEFKNQDLKGSRFTHVDLSETHFHDLFLRDARFTHVDLSGTHIHDAALGDVRITGVWMKDVEIEAEIEGTLIVNGVDVRPFVDATLNERYPGREAIFAVERSGVDGFREAMRVLDEAWPSTIERLRNLPPDKLHERVDDQWSPIENLRHLVFAIDAWANRALLGDPSPYDPLDLPHTEMGEVEGVPNDPDARPSLDEVLALHDDRLAVVREQIESLTEERLAGMTEPTPGPGYPASQPYEVRRCLVACLIEEWEHRRYIERDLAVLEAKSSARAR